MKRVVSQLGALTEEQEIRFGDSVLQVAVQENEKIFGKIKQEEGNMCEALRKLFEPELNEAIKGAEKKRNRDIILNAIKAGNSLADIAKVMLISEEEIREIALENC